jgi:beta-propeller repeat-containing protein
MKPYTRVTPFLVLFVLAICVLGWGQQPVTAAQHDAIMQQYLTLPLNFEVNHGQAIDNARFLARANGYGVMLEPDALAFVLPGNNHQQSIVQLGWVGASTQQIAGEQPLAGRINYLHGKDAKAWITEVPTFAHVRYHQLYRGVDAVFYGNKREVEYDLAVSPGAITDNIAFRVSGADKVTIDGNGDLVLATKNGELRQHVPVVYQEVAGKHTPVAARYELRADGTVKLALGAYDSTRALVIDPTLTYSTYLGGSGDDSGRGIAADSTGHAYVTGGTRWGFPTKNAFQGNQPNDDAFVTKFWATGGGLIYSTYLGGSDNEAANAIAIDSSGNAYVTGTTSSTDFPVTAGAFQQTNASPPDAFVTKLSASGSSLVWSSYLGGSFEDMGNGIAIDSSRRVYVVGASIESGGFPIMNCFDANGGWAFITRFNADGATLSYSCKFGGAGGSFGVSGTIANAVAVDSNANAYVTGAAGSGFASDVSANAFQPKLACETSDGVGQDAFALKVSTTDTVVYASYLGGCSSDQGNAIAIDTSGNAYIAGYTLSTDFPTTSGAFQRTKPANTGTNNDFSGFVTKVNATGTAKSYSTYLHGSGGDQINGIAVDGNGRAYVTGHIYSGTFPLSGAFQSTGNVFVTKLWATGGGLIWSTRMGGSNTGDTGLAIALDSSLNVYATGQTFSSDFHTTTGAFRRTLTGTSDAFVVKIHQ